MSEPNAEQKLREGLDFIDAFKQEKPDPKIPSKPSEIVKQVLEVDTVLDGEASVLYPFMHGLLCGLKLGGL